MQPTPQSIGLILCDDLMFSSRITATGKMCNLSFRTAKSAAELEQLSVKERPSCVILDLANPGLAIADMVRQLRPEGAGPFIVAYGSHVDTAKLAAAREAGCDVVLTRSKFVEELPTGLPRWFAGQS
jgi:DNA-binding response OmpR family regulator